jgi:glycosyltransferase involved in cell wall biosynthesis
MFISIITINYNNADGLERTIQSVLLQENVQIEYIIIDGGSTDDSVKIIRRFSEKISYWVSEKDRGVYDAMNKGISQAKGDYLLFLNSGDFLISGHVLSKLFGGTKNGADIVYGDLKVRTNVTLNSITFPDELPFSFVRTHSLPHPATLIKRELFQKVGLYDIKLKIAADWKFFMLALYKHNTSYFHVPEFITEYNLDGISSQPQNMPIITAEKDAVMKEHFEAFREDYENLEKFRSVYMYYTASRKVKLLRSLKLIR